jgi:hypothetical protein
MPVLKNWQKYNYMFSVFYFNFQDLLLNLLTS